MISLYSASVISFSNRIFAGACFFIKGSSSFTAINISWGSRPLDSIMSSCWLRRNNISGVKKKPSPKSTSFSCTCCATGRLLKKSYPRWPNSQSLFLSEKTCSSFIAAGPVMENDLLQPAASKHSKAEPSR